MKLQSSMVGESHCHVAKAISRKVVKPRASGITHSPGTMIVVKGVTTICRLEPTVLVFFQSTGDFELYTPYYLGSQVK